METILFLSLLAFCVYLNSKINKLAKQVMGRQPVPQTATSIPQPGEAVQPIPPPATFTPADIEIEPTVVDEFFAWLKQDFLMKLGAGLLLLALGWFVSYAFANNWIGPVGRITLGLSVSSLVLVWGVMRAARYVQQGSVLIILGAAGILITLYAARELYDMFTPGLVLFLSFMTAIFVAFASLRYKRRALAYAGLIVGSIAPLLTNTPEPDALGFFLYLLLVAVGTLWVVWQTGWTGLILASLIITGWYSILWLVEATADQSIAVIFSFLFVTLYFGANMVSLIRRRTEGKLHMPIHAAVAAGTALFLFLWIQTGVSAEWHSLLYVAWSFVFVLGAYVVYQFTANYLAFYVYGATAAVLLAIATAAELSGASLVIAYTLQLLAMLAVLYRFIPIPSVLAKASVLFAVPVALALPLLEYTRWDSAIGVESLTLLVVITALTIVALFLERVDNKSESDIDGVRLVGYGAGLIAIVFAAIVAWGMIHVLFGSLSVAIALILYTVVGVGLLITAQMEDRPIMKLVGACFIGFVIARLLLIEVWNMPIELRIVAFVVIGIVLISTAFIGKKIIQNHD